ncbi:hypothetical protein Y1Q_0012755 [Alligator mississippiensis]|uniref:Uncharacterized protein n=1 Tax=Alligator mississippiensis TaxID=8496 RepID=A0A151PFS3_ALLMI|nr:hypothetical protein Y1Q_0012755 [Alligator mississippiensis]
MPCFGVQSEKGNKLQLQGEIFLYIPSQLLGDNIINVLASHQPWQFSPSCHTAFRKLVQEVTHALASEYH